MCSSDLIFRQKKEGRYISGKPLYWTLPLSHFQNQNPWQTLPGYSTWHTELPERNSLSSATVKVPHIPPGMPPWEVLPTGFSRNLHPQSLSNTTPGVPSYEALMFPHPPPEVPVLSPDGAKQAEKKEVSGSAPNESVAGQAGNAAFQPSLSDEIAAEISYAEEREKEITEKQKAADTQMDMNITAAEMYQMWDDTLNIVWGLLEANLNEVDMEVLRKEEKEWIAFKDAEVQAAGQECEGGSIQPSVEASRAADLTKARVYELAEYAK